MNTDRKPLNLSIDGGHATAVKTDDYERLVREHEQLLNMLDRFVDVAIKDSQHNNALKKHRGLIIAASELVDRIKKPPIIVDGENINVRESTETEPNTQGLANTEV